jgi:cytochrome c-type biogenesis protein CcmE
MRGQLVKIIASVFVVGGGLAYLLYSTAGEAFEYYKHVDEVVPAIAKWRGKPMQLHGYVVPGSIKKRFDREHGRLEYKLVETNCGQQIDVRYAGVPPDTFKDGAEVVVKGSLEGDGFQSTEIMAKCPSKYAAQSDPRGDLANMCTRGKAN